jgi:hypothetical protein
MARELPVLDHEGNTFYVPLGGGPHLDHEGALPPLSEIDPGVYLPPKNKGGPPTSTYVMTPLSQKE